MLWINLFAFFLLTAGHCQVVVAAINLLHALRVRVAVLKQARRIHDVVIPLFPILLVWRLGIAGPQLLRGGLWSDVPPAWGAYLALCAVGSVALTIGAVRWLLWKPTPIQESNHSEVIDVPGVLGHRPLGGGRYRLMTSMPGNQAFQLELTEKTFRHPALRAEWDGLSILHLSDVHFLGTITRPYFDYAFDLIARKPVDLIVFTGDLFDNLELADWLRTTFARLNAPLGRYFILGNHDWYQDEALIRRWMVELGWTDVAGRVTTITHLGREMVLGGSELPWMGTRPDFSKSPSDAFRLLLSHTPDNLPDARRQKVDLMLSGHNHGGQIVLPVIGPVYSPSFYGVKYAAGTFYEPPTLLHVSRGLSGRYPLRWNCRPEVTRIILRSPPLNG